MNIPHLADPEQLIRDGRAHLGAGRHADAEAAFAAALQLRPNAELALFGLATSQFEQGDFARAAASFDALIGLAPMNAQYRYNQGYCRLMNREYDTAEVILRRVLAVLDEPRVAASHALALYWSSQPDEQRAIDQLLRCAVALPADAAIQASLANLLLASGDYRRGLRLLERRGSLQAMLPRYEVPLWRGESLQDTHLLLWCEQGHGDSLQCVRFVPVLARRAAAEGGTLTLVASEPLRELFAASLAALAPTVTVVGASGPVRPYHWHCPLLSLPERMQATPENLPAEPYLRAPDDRTAAWSERVRGLPGIRVGLAWAGNRRGEGGRHSVQHARRSLSAAELAPLLDVPGVAWISLQKDRSDDDRGAFDARPNVVDWTPDLDSFADTAALIDQLDLVISSDTAVCHLAGALGKPAWMFETWEGDWRWARGRDTSPWYPELRRYRQATPGDWAGPVEAMRRDLAQMVRTADTGG